MGGNSCRFWKKIKVSLIHAAYYGEDTSFLYMYASRFISFFMKMKFRKSETKRKRINRK